MDLPEVAHPGQLQLAATAVGVAGELRVLDAAVRVHVGIEQTAGAPQGGGQSGEPTQVELLRLQPQLERPPLGIQAVRADRGQPEIRRRGRFQSRLTAVGRNDPGGDPALAVGVAGLELRVTDRRLIELEVAGLHMGLEARRAQRAVDGEIGVQGPVQGILSRAAGGIARQAEPLHLQRTDHGAQAKRSVDEPASILEGRHPGAEARLQRQERVPDTKDPDVGLGGLPVDLQLDPRVGGGDARRAHPGQIERQGSRRIDGAAAGGDLQRDRPAAEHRVTDQLAEHRERDLCDVAVELERRPGERRGIGTTAQQRSK